MSPTTRTIALAAVLSFAACIPPAYAFDIGRYCAERMTSSEVIECVTRQHSARLWIETRWSINHLLTRFEKMQMLPCSDGEIRECNYRRRQFCMTYGHEFDAEHGHDLWRCK